MDRMPPRSSPEKGFTLVELLIVIGVMSVLLSMVVLAVNPARQMAQANNTKRRGDVNTILNAISQYAADNRGNVSGMNGGNGIPSTLTEIGSGAGQVNLCPELVPIYIAEMPTDPITGTGVSGTDCSGSYTTGYHIQATAGAAARITVSAPGVELGDTISVTR